MISDNRLWFDCLFNHLIIFGNTNSSDWTGDKAFARERKHLEHKHKNACTAVWYYL